MLLPDAETAIATSQDGGNLVVETPDDDIVLEGFFAATSAPVPSRVRAFGAASGSEEDGLESAVAFLDAEGFKVITPTSAFVSGSYTLPTYEGAGLPEDGSVSRTFVSSSASRSDLLEQLLSEPRAVGTQNDGDHGAGDDLTDPIQLAAGLAGGDTPTATNLTNTVVYFEGDTAVVLPDIVVADADTNETITALLTLANPGSGALSTSGTASYNTATGIWTVSGSVDAVNAALADVRFIPAADNATDTTITTSVTDAAGTGPAQGVITLDFTPVNDPPTATNLSSTAMYTEGDANVPLADIVVNDIDTGDVITATLTLAIPAAGALSAASGNGESYSAATGVWTVTGSVAEVNAALAAVEFVPAPDNDVNTAVTTHIEDAAGAGPGDGTITLNVTPVNDAPVNTFPAASQIVERGVDLTFNAGNGNLLSVADLDAAATDITVTLTASDAGAALTLNPGALGGMTSVIGDGSAVVTLVGSQAALNAALNGLTYNTPSVGPQTVTVQTNDGGNTGAGGALTDTERPTHVEPDHRPVLHEWR